VQGRLGETESSSTEARFTVRVGARTGGAMKTLFTPEGFRALRASWILLGLAVAAAIAVGVGGHWITERDIRDGTAADKRVRDARTRLDGARRERDNLAESAEVFRALVERGILQDERRLDLVELVAELRRRHKPPGARIRHRAPAAAARKPVRFRRGALQPREAARAGAARGRPARLRRGARALAARALSGGPVRDEAHRRPAADVAAAARGSRLHPRVDHAQGEEKEHPVGKGLLAALLVLALPAMPADLGTLFHTAEERARLDALRRGEPATPSRHGHPLPSRRGPRSRKSPDFVKRSDGRNTVWIDGRAITAPSNARTAPLFDPRVVRDLEQNAPSDIKLVPSKKNSEP
jgi:uncharacterized membrane-anchored protein YhcB (DUF1043 family)